MKALEGKGRGVILYLFFFAFLFTFIARLSAGNYSGSVDVYAIYAFISLSSGVEYFVNISGDTSSMRRLK